MAFQTFGQLASDSGSDDDCTHGRIGQLQNITHFSKVKIFRELVYNSNLPLSRKQVLATNYELNHGDPSDQATDSQQDGGSGEQQQSQVKKDRVFHPFPRLPPELRHMIFQEAAEARILPMDCMTKFHHVYCEPTYILRRRMPVVASVSREARDAVKLLGRSDLRTGFRAQPSQLFQVGTTPQNWVSNCGFLMGRDVVHYTFPFDFSEVIEDSGTDAAAVVHHPRKIPSVLGTTTVAVSLAGLPPLHYFNGGIWNAMAKWSFLKDMKSLETLYIVLSSSSIIYERNTAKIIPKSICDYTGWDDNVSVLVDIYDDQRLAEITSLDVPYPVKLGPGRWFNIRHRDAVLEILGTCLHCLRERWESEVKPRMEKMWVLLHVDDPGQQDFEEIVNQDDGKINRDHPWVRTKLDTMPQLRVFVDFNLRSAVDI